MGYKVGSDTNPPILAAQLSAGAGQLMALSITVPAAYYDSHKPIGYIYAQGYGGQVSSVNAAADSVTITAHSKAGDSVLTYVRVNPVIQSAGSVQSWLSGLCALGDVTAQYSADAAILSSAPYIHQQAVADLMGVLQTIANCYGIDVYHISANTGDVILFAQPGLTAAGSLDGMLSALTYTDQDREYEQCVIVRTAPIEQHAKTPLNRERISHLQQTAQNHPYLEAEIQYNEIDRYWDGRITTFDYNELRELDQTVTIADPDEMDDTDQWYKSRFVYAPYFGDWLKEGHETERDALYLVRPGGQFRVDSIPPDYVGGWEHVTDSSESEQRQYFGVWSTNHPYSFYSWRITENGQTNSGSQLKDFGGVYPDPPYEIYINYGNGTSRSAIEYYIRSSQGEDTQTGTDAGESDYSDNLNTYKPSAAQYPWSPTVRQVVSSSTTRTEDPISFPWDQRYTTTQALTVSKALLDSDWDDFVKPPTIDENYLATGSLDAVTLDKTPSGVWFDAEANPAEDRQFMGLGCVQNYKYSLATSQEKIYIQSGHEPGRLTAMWQDGTNPPQYYNLRSGMSLNRIYTGDQTLQLTLISSTGKSFATAPANATGKSYTITGSVWPSREIALLCIPYISRIHNHGRTFSATIPAALLSLADTFGLLGKVKTLRNETVYITGITADLKAEAISLTGYVVTE